jgi:ribosomal protein S18 acetylase RimI-like enzyme
MLAADLPAVNALADRVHGAAFFEPPEIFAERLKLFPDGCFVAGDPVGGYAVAHPWAGPAPALGSLVKALPEAPDHLFLHDVALRRELRGRGLAAALVDLLRGAAAARGLSAIRLTAVHGTAPRWARLGFAGDGGAVSAGYGAGAVAMRLSLLRP